MKKRLYVLLFCMLNGALFDTRLLGLVNPIEGENLWRMVSRIGFMVDQIFLDQLSIGDVLCSKIEAVDDNLLSVGDVLCSKLEMIDDDLLSVGDVLCSKIEGIQEANESINDLLCSKIEMVDDDLLSVADVLCEKSMDLSSQLDTIAESMDRCTYTIVQSDIPYTISAPGLYCLGEDISGTNNGAALITVDSDDVRFDFIEFQITSGLNTIGIQINANLNNIKLLTSTSGFGHLTSSAASMPNINVSSGVSNLVIQNLEIECRDFATSGISVAASAQHITIRDCSITNSTGTGVVLFGGDVFNLSNVEVVNAGAVGISFTNCDTIQCSDCSAKNSSGIGLVIGDTTNPSAVISACVEGFASVGSGSHGFDILADKLIMDGCKAIGNTNSGFIVSANRMNLIGCISIENGDLFADPSVDYGFYLRPEGTGVSMKITDCVAESVPVGFDAVGNGLCMDGCSASQTVEECFRFGPSSYMLIQNCVANDAIRAYTGQYSLFGAGFHLRGAEVGNPPFGTGNRVIGCAALNCEVGFMVDEDGIKAYNAFFDNIAVGSGTDALFHSYNVNGVMGTIMLVPTGAAIPESGAMLPNAGPIWPDIRVNLLGD